jgi:purine-nucleoside phosphorylase|tara:strand:- start:17014 stop:17793 length:780 start_codon:yes stop_codon:yes gene_type:complete
VVLIKDLQEKLRFNGDTGVILGSGLGSLADALNEKISISFNDIESFPVSTVSGHNSDFVSGFYDNNQLLLSRGRFHFYEGFDLNTITLPVKVFNQLGVKNIIITNSSGSMNIKNVPGALMIINGHYDCTFIEGSSMPILKEGEEYYNSKMINNAKKAAAMNSIKLLQGKYCWTMGPAYETPAEIKFLSKLGGDAVGMSTVPEIEYAKKLNMNILVISALTNFAAGLKDTILTHEDVLVNAKKIGQDFAKLLLETVINLD